VAAAVAAAATGNGHGGNGHGANGHGANGHGGNGHGANGLAGDTWQVTVPGGTLGVTLEAGGAWLTGPAVIVAEGELDPSWLATVGDAAASH